MLPADQWYDYRLGTLLEQRAQRAPSLPDSFYAQRGESGYNGMRRIFFESVLNFNFSHDNAAPDGSLHGPLFL